MKKIIVILIFATIFMNCSSDNTMEVFLNQDENINQSVYVMGNFIDGSHPTSGKAAVNLEKTLLRFTNFKTDNGPKLLVYLATDANATEFVNLGDLKGISGDFTYSIPVNTDLTKYNIVNIWCVDFSVSFGTATLK
jgi:hypothetical protein